MQQIINRIVNAIVGFLIAAFKSTDPNRPLPAPAPFPVGTPPTPDPIAPDPILPLPDRPPPGGTLPPGPIVPGQEPATYALRWNAGITAFTKKWRGKFIPPKFGGDYQCVALVNEWAQEMWGVYWPRLSAAGDFVGYNVPGFIFIRNTPTNYPYPGDIVEWGKSPNLPWGHMGVAEGATAMKLTTFDQNWPLHSPAHDQGHTYVGVSGWHRKI